MSINETLHEIQVKLKAPKSQWNNFGKYNYRNCEDIVEAVKKILPKDAVLILSDSIEMIGERYYVKATATLSVSGGDRRSVDAYARESFDKKGMDSAQLTGATSSYARKYALNGLFCIDDTKDADSVESAPQQQPKPVGKDEYDMLVANMEAAQDSGNLKEAFGLVHSAKPRLTPSQYDTLVAIKDKRKGEITNVDG